MPLDHLKRLRRQHECAGIRAILAATYLYFDTPSLTLVNVDMGMASAIWVATQKRLASQWNRVQVSVAAISPSLLVSICIKAQKRRSRFSLIEGKSVASARLCNDQRIALILSQ